MSPCNAPDLLGVSTRADLAGHSGGDPPYLCFHTETRSLGSLEPPGSLAGQELSHFSSDAGAGFPFGMHPCCIDSLSVNSPAKCHPSR